MNGLFMMQKFILITLLQIIKRQELNQILIVKEFKAYFQIYPLYQLLNYMNLSLIIRS